MNNAFVALNFALVYVLWGSTYLAMQVVVTEHIPPAMMGALRFTTAGVILLIVCAILGKKLTLSPRTFLRVGIIGLLLLSSGNVFVGWAEEYVPTGFAALLIATVPLWMALIERFVFNGNRLPLRTTLGLGFGLLGITVLVWPKLTASGEPTSVIWFGAVILLVAAFSWSLGSVLSRRWGSSGDVLVATAWEMLIAGLFNGAVAIALGNHHTVVWTTKGVAALAYLVVAGSLIGFTAYIWLLKNVPLSKVSTYAYVNPIVAVFLGWLILGESVDAFVFVGAAVIVCSVWLVNSSKVKQAKV